MKKTFKDIEVKEENKEVVMPRQTIESKGYICRAIKFASILVPLYPDINGLVDYTLPELERKPNKGYFVKSIKLSAAVGALKYYPNSSGQIDIRVATRTLEDKKMLVNSIRVSDIVVDTVITPVIYTCLFTGIINMDTIV